MNAGLCPSGQGRPCPNNFEACSADGCRFQTANLDRVMNAPLRQFVEAEPETNHPYDYIEVPGWLLGCVLVGICFGASMGVYRLFFL